MERIKLNLIPSGVAPIVHLSQYDDGRQFGIDLFEGESVYVLDGTETLTVNSRKPDGHVVTLTVTNTGTSSLDVDTVEQLTAVHGVSYAKLQIVKGAVTIATLPFLIDVSRDPLENGDPSESFIQNLETQVSEMVAEDVAEQYDSANVIFDNAPTSGHGTPYTVTSEGIKTAIDNAFDYDNTASGSIVHIEDGADNIPVKSLVSQIVAVETGTGEKSPDNPYIISGFDSGVVTRCGKNLLKNRKTTTTVNGVTLTVNNDGSITLSGTASTSFQFNFNNPYLKSAKYTMSNGNTNLIRGIALFAVTPSGNKDVNRTTGFVTFEDSVGIVALWIASGTNTNGITIKPMIELGEMATNFEAYNGNTYTFAFGQTVYGGHFDNKGNLVVTHEIIDLGDLTYTYYTGGTNPIFYGSITGAKVYSDGDTINAICSCYDNFGVSRNRTNLSTLLGNNQFSFINNGTNFTIRNDSYTDPNTFKTAMTGQKVVYELANPITLAITSQDIPTALGENNIFSNCGDIEVTYYTYKANDVLDFINSEIDKKNGDNIPIEEGSPDSIKDYIDDEVSTINTSLSNKANKTEDTTITLASGYSLISSSCGKTDRLVHLNFNVEKTGGFTTGWQAIGTTEFKPNTLAYCPLWNVTNGVGNGEVRIDTDGTINFYIVTAGELRLNANIGYITD